MATMSAAELLDWLGKNSFLPAHRIEELRPLLSTYPDGHAFAKELIHRDLLTPYQVNQILQGKGDQLMVGANRLLERLGEGAMGQVFKAWNTRLGRVVAVKMIHKNHVANKKAMERFQRELAIAGELAHPNIVLVRDADEWDGKPYLVMDFIEGEELSKRVKRTGSLPIADAVEFTRQAALGLQHALEHGVVHRDIKPGNLMLVSGGVVGGGTQQSGTQQTRSQESPLTTHHSPLTTHQIKILDFGLARFESETYQSSRLTYAGNVIGTVDYIAPEQANDAHSADIRADIYSLGCTLYYLLTGAVPFPGNTVVEKVTARTQGDPPSVRRTRPKVSAELDAVLRRMMAREPGARYQTPLEVAQTLAPFVHGTCDQAIMAEASPADAVAAQTPWQTAQAIPVTEPLPAGVPVVHAVPLSSAATMPDGVPVVQAIAVGAAFAPLATPVEIALPTAQPRAKAAPTPPSKKRHLVVAAGLIVVLAASLILIVTLRRGRDNTAARVYGPGATLRLLPVEAMQIKEGRKTPVIVAIERKDFSGPVRVYFEKLPDGFQSQEITLTDKQDMSQLYLTVSFGMGAMKRDLRLVAVAENLRDATMLPVTVESSRKEKQFKPRSSGDEGDR
jgi:serine/threonine protein kinase